MVLPQNLIDRIQIIPYRPLRNLELLSQIRFCYAAAPVYGEKKVVGVELNMTSFINQETSDVDMLIEEICPLPQ